jgi:hypothetical protein
VFSARRPPSASAMSTSTRRTSAISPMNRKGSTRMRPPKSTTCSVCSSSAMMKSSSTRSITNSPMSVMRRTRLVPTASPIVPTTITAAATSSSAATTKYSIDWPAPVAPRAGVARCGPARSSTAGDPGLAAGALPKVEEPVGGGDVHGRQRDAQRPPVAAAVRPPGLTGRGGGLTTSSPSCCARWRPARAAEPRSAGRRPPSARSAGCASGRPRWQTHARGTPSTSEPRP